MFEDIVAQIKAAIPQLAGATIVDFSYLIIGIAVILIIISVLIIFFLKRRSPTEKHAEYIAKIALDLKKGKVKLTPKPVVQSKVVANDSKNKDVASKITSQKTESSLKSLLIKKFQSKIESQLGSKIIISDLTSADNNFVAYVEVAGVKLLLTLDSSGKIIDYKKVKGQ